MYWVRAMPTKKELEAIVQQQAEQIKKLNATCRAFKIMGKHSYRLYQNANKNAKAKEDKFNKEHALLSMLYYDKRYGEEVGKGKARAYANEEGLRLGYITAKKSKRWLDQLQDGGKYFEDWPI